MNISYNWLQTYFDKPLPKVNELADLINSHVFEVESIESVGKDFMMDLKVLPDRSHHALCHRGVVREIRAISGNTMTDKGKNKDFKVGSSGAIGIKVEIQAKDFCKRYIAKRIDNIKIKPSPTWLKERLEAVGSRSINNIVDATNFVMLDIGQPLHAFDADKIKGAIIVRLAKKGERIELLPERVTSVDEKGCPIIVEKERTLELSESDLVIADQDGPIAIAGVKGGRRAEITNDTKNIILESANFNPVSVRRTSTRLNLRNDSSKRFENEIIPELAEEAMVQVVDLIAKLNPEAQKKGIVDIFNTPTKSWNIKVTSSFVSDKLGVKVTDDELENILSSYDCKIEKKGNEFIITPPLDRLDMRIREDIVDEVAKVKGYESVKSTLPPDLSAKDIVGDKTFYWSEKIKNILIDMGYSETMLYSLAPNGHFEIIYPLANDKCALRESIVQKMKDSLSANTLNADLLGLDNIKIFEIGKVFPKGGERTVLCMGVNMVKKQKGVKPSNILLDTLKELKDSAGIDLVGSEKINIKDESFGATIEIPLDEFISKFSVGDTKDLNFKPLPRSQQYHRFSQYPFIVRDIAVFVPENIVGDGVWQAIKQGLQEAKSAELLIRSALFDVFKKDGKVSYAYRLVFQSYEKTLTDEEVNKIMEAIYNEIKERGWMVR